MATEWRFKAQYIKNCNCAMGCPCDFWATPTHGSCQGMFADRVLEGHYGKIKLDGLIFAGTHHWPGALHLGNGTFQPYVLDKSAPEQREAILTIMSGKAGNAGTRCWPALYRACWSQGSFPSSSSSTWNAAMPASTFPANCSRPRSR